MVKNAKAAFALCIATLISPDTASAEPAQNQLSNTEAFRTAYRMSFFGFDLCGDVAIGALYRKALTEKVAHCPFTPAAKADFGKWTADADQRVSADVQRYIAEHDKLPDRLDEKRVSCRTERQTPAYQKTVTLLDRYAKGEAKFDDVVPDRCDIQAAKP